MKLVRLTAVQNGLELGAIDGEELRVHTTPDGELLIDNGYRGFFGVETGYGWADLLGPDYKPDVQVQLTLTIIDADE
jgi:hypothetical protein